MRATIEWNVREVRVKLKRVEQSDTATVVDLSLDGALIEAPPECKHAKGDIVTVRLGGAVGEAQIRHVSLSDDQLNWRYGIKWRHTPALRAAVESGVEQLRGNAAEVRRAWEEQRR